MLLRKSIDVTDRSFVRCTKEAVAHMHEAGQVLYTAVHRWIVSILARSATADVVATQPEYVLLRSSSADSWDIKKYRHFVFNHVKAGRVCWYVYHCFLSGIRPVFSFLPSGVSTCPMFSMRCFHSVLVVALNTSGALVPIVYSSGSTKSFKTKAWKLQHPSLVFF